VTGKFHLDTAQVSVKREEILANTTNNLKCDTNNLANVTEFNTAHKQNVSNKTSNHPPY
jgi:hypothetical protein